MRHVTIVVYATFVLLFACSAMAQSSSTQLCVANMQSVNAGPNPAGRDALMKFLSKEKDKSVAEDVPLDASEPGQALQQAKSRNCDYLITTNQTESHQENSIMNTSGPFGQTSTPTFYVTTAYKLIRVSDGSEVTGGTVKAGDHDSEQAAVSITMHKIADKVTQAIKKAGH